MDGDCQTCGGNQQITCTCNDISQNFFAGNPSPFLEGPEPVPTEGMDVCYHIGDGVGEIWACSDSTPQKHQDWTVPDNPAIHDIENRKVYDGIQNTNQSKLDKFLKIKGKKQMTKFFS